MATPGEHLPKPISDEAINNLLVHLGLPKATAITKPNVTASYHAIYLITVPDNDEYKPHTELVLRESGNHLPAIKTKNEVGIMAWVARNTKIPVPEVIAYDATTNNPIRHEFTLLSRATGKTLSDIYDSLDEAELDGILDQLIDILVDLHTHDWQHIGGLNMRDGTKTGEVVPARIVDETFWQAGDLGLWPADETVESLNVAGPYTSWTGMVAAYVRHYIRLVQIHERLAFMREFIPRLEAFTDKITQPDQAAKLNKTRFVLAHKDLHFANLLYENGRISAVLDWEFSQVVPNPLWNPRKAFLWNGQETHDSLAEKRRLVARFEDRVRARGDPQTAKLLLEGQEFASSEQNAMQRIVDYLRAITEVAPRGGREEVLSGWKNTILENLSKFDC